MKYLAYYDTPDNGAENRSYALAATNKVTYICDAINRGGIPVEIISASGTGNRKGCRGKTVQVLDNTTLKLFSCMGTGGLLKKLVGRILFKLKYFLYLFFGVKKNEKVIVYHSMVYASLIMLLKRLKKFYLILEVEEVYTDVTGKESDRKKENRLFSTADAYIFPTELLHKKLNTKNKPYIVIYGTYHVEEDRKCNFEEDYLKEKIHCVYAGTFDPRKGCLAAAEAAKYLSENYHIHILGFGTKEQIETVRRKVEELSKECRCGISYDGCLRGEEYIRFIQCCQIGLSPQDEDAAFNDTSFPSKILSYMANGLQVVGIRMPTIEASSIGHLIWLFDKSTPEAIAQAIKKVKLKDNRCTRIIVSQLDETFVADMKRLLEV